MVLHFFWVFYRIFFDICEISHRYPITLPNHFIRRRPLKKRPPLGFLVVECLKNKILRLRVSLIAYPCDVNAFIYSSVIIVLSCIVGLLYYCPFIDLINFQIHLVFIHWNALFSICLLLHRVYLRNSSRQTLELSRGWFCVITRSRTRC